MINVVPPELISEELCKLALKQTPPGDLEDRESLLPLIPNRCRTEQICLIELKNCAIRRTDFHLIPPQCRTNILCKMAVEVQCIGVLSIHPKGAPRDNHYAQ